MISDQATNDSPTELEFFWRPGCGFCIALEQALNRADIAVTKRNIWEEPGAAEVVRAAADGNETVPTVRIKERALVNPSIDEVTALLRQVAPDLLSES